MDWLFQKDIGEITFEDLRDRLPDVPEGMFVEYKRAGTGNDDIAKAIAAFANTYGGWLFIGIAEDESKENRPHPEGFTGVEGRTRGVDTIYQIVNDQLSPGAYVRVHPVPVKSGDGVSRHILAVKVMESDDPPVLRRRDGRVYRRTGSVSPPLDHIKDRRELDELYAKGRENQRRVLALREEHQDGGELFLTGMRLLERECTDPVGALLLLSYPWQPSLRADLPVAHGSSIPVADQGALAGLLQQVSWWRYLGPHMVILINGLISRALLVNEHGHVGIVAYYRDEQPKPSWLNYVSAAGSDDTWHSRLQEFYVQNGFHGRLGLVYRFFHGETEKARLEHSTTVGDLASLDLARLKEEAARALGSRDQMPPPRA